MGLRYKIIERDGQLFVEVREWWVFVIFCKVTIEMFIEDMLGIVDNDDN